MLKDLISQAEKKGVSFDANSYAFSKKEIITRMKAYIGRGILDNEAFYPIILSADKTFLKAVENFEKE